MNLCLSRDWRITISSEISLKSLLWLYLPPFEFAFRHEQNPMVKKRKDKINVKILHCINNRMNAHLIREQQLQHLILWTNRPISAKQKSLNFMCIGIKAEAEDAANCGQTSKKIIIGEPDFLSFSLTAPVGISTLQNCLSAIPISQHTGLQLPKFLREKTAYYIQIYL